jgi:hypothetical protein
MTVDVASKSANLVAMLNASKDDGAGSTHGATSRLNGTDDATVSRAREASVYLCDLLHYAKAKLRGIFPGDGSRYPKYKDLAMRLASSLNGWNDFASVQHTFPLVFSKKNESCNVTDSAGETRSRSNSRVVERVVQNSDGAGCDEFVVDERSRLERLDEVCISRYTYIPSTTTITSTSIKLVILIVSLKL